MRPGHAQADVRLATLVRDAELRALEPQVAHLPAPQPRCRARTEPNDRAVEFVDDRRDALVVDVQYGGAIVGQTARERQLLPLDRIHTPELLQVRGPDVEHGADRGLRDAAQLGDLALAIHRHLQHGDLVLPAQAHQGEGQPLARVQVPGAVVCLESCGQGGGRQLLGRRLPHRPRDARHANAAASPPVPRELGHRRARVAHDGQRPVGPVPSRRAFADRCRRAPLQRFVDEVVAVEPLAPEGREQVARLRQARVGRAAGNRGVGARDHPVAVGAHALCQEGCRHARHLVATCSTSG